ncbi:thiol-disulfide oxidoreductase DCC family protein [Bacillus sp. DJP31]|uniref:thiol-disulfide oxidoreductase DCC family protein n=1 Tax=Bacillus sp. DJP31 TaxID=3409789 RepID=UPI003BB80F99
MKYSIVLFDGVCNLCNGAIQFLLKYDKKERLRFASLQSETGQRLLAQYQLPTDDFDSFVVIANGKAFRKSVAALEICKQLGGWFIPFLIFRVVPSPVRDSIYSGVANNRYKWFGKQEHCMIPTPELRKRFLE